MIQKIKDALNNSIVWLLALLAGITYFWLKERDLEDKLEEAKADATIKDAKESVREADSHADDDEAEYDRVCREYAKRRRNTDD